ncbi:hypothetical protein [Vibrio rumoiensis]|uniref:hypothetical protein n=1 Tax=Vibrio rumoiensis TaxID=76258 RepID=UPI003AA7C9E0
MNNLTQQSKVNPCQVKDTQAGLFVGYMKYVAQAMPSHIQSPENTALIRKLITNYSSLHGVERPQATQQVWVGSNESSVTIEFADRTCLVFNDSGMTLTLSPCVIKGEECQSH